MASRGSNSSTFSVIGSDVTIKGDVSASVDLHVDGSIEGDIHCASLVQGESSVLTGSVIAQSARLAGKVAGSIKAKELVVLKSARIEGDVHYDALTIEQGAHVDGRFAHNAQAPAKGQGQAHGQSQGQAQAQAQAQTAARTEQGGDKPASPDEPKLSIAG